MLASRLGTSVGPRSEAFARNAALQRDLVRELHEGTAAAAALGGRAQDRLPCLYLLDSGGAFLPRQDEVCRPGSTPSTQPPAGSAAARTPAAPGSSAAPARPARSPALTSLPVHVEA